MNVMESFELSQATGGKVWKTPSRFYKLKTTLTFIGAVVWACRALWAFLLWGVMVWVVVSAFYGVRHLETAALHEYGYTDVLMSIDKPVAMVTVVETGETKEVKVAEYNEATIFYETQEQLEEKKRKVDAGTYLNLRP